MLQESGSVQPAALGRDEQRGPVPGGLPQPRQQLHGPRHGRQRAPRVRPADQRAGAVRGLGGGGQPEGGRPRGTLRHRQGEGKQARPLYRVTTLDSSPEMERNSATAKQLA